MARASKFSLPNFSRNSKPDKKSTTSLQQDLPNCSYDTNSVSKAERLLGPSSMTNDNEPRRKTSIDSNGRNRLTKYPSNMSLVSPDFRSGANEERRRVQKMRHTRASSPVQSINYRDHGSRQTTHPQYDAGRSVRSSQSFYVASASPLSISQQTSASSSRDLALRKGYPSIGSRYRDDLSPQSGGRKAEKDTPGRHGESSNTRSRVTNIDMLMVPPKPRSLARYLRSSRRASEHPSTASPIHEQKLVKHETQHRWRGLVTSRPTSQQSITNPTKNRHRTSSYMLDNETTSLREEVRAPAKVAQNWLEVAEAEDSRKISPSRSVEERVPKHPEASARVSGSSSSSSSVRTLTSRHSEDVVQLQSKLSEQRLPLSNLKDDDRSLSQMSRTSKISRLGCSDLHTQSVLSLSSSEDESETDSPPNPPIRQHAARNSGGSHTAPADPRPSRTSRSDSLSSHHARTKQHSSVKRDRPHTPAIRETLSPVLPTPPPPPPRSSSRQCVQSVHWQTDGSAGSISVGTAISDYGPPTTAPARVETIQIDVRKRHDPRMSRIMAVTKEEGKLLEAMRVKRASMRKKDLVEGYNIAMEHNLVPSPPRRPKTTEDARRRSSSFFEADMSCFPTPPTDAASSLQAPGPGPGRPRISVDDWNLRSESLHTGRQSGSGSRSSYVASASTPSSKLSFAASDLVPSPTTTHGAPRTPPADELVPEAYRSELGMETGEFFGERKGQGRSRTFGGGLIILDGAREGGGDGGEGEGIAEWAVGTCI